MSTIIKADAGYELLTRENPEIPKGKILRQPIIAWTFHSNDITMKPIPITSNGIPSYDVEFAIKFPDGTIHVRRNDTVIYQDYYQWEKSWNPVGV